ncbi:MAG: Patatin [Fusobacteriales bacterium]|jgi:NTE family protein|nr:Patatin [Fusobacteriales bacterium]
MKKILIILFAIFSINIYSNENKKIGVALAGGGGKGFFHIGVLKVLEEEKVPIDYITGNSIGAIIGSLYSIGYTAKDLENIVTIIDWQTIFDDTPSRKEKPMDGKNFSDKYALVMPYEKNRVKTPQGVFYGEKIYLTLKELMWNARYVKDFNEYPIPFRAIATDLITGEPIVFSKGDLAKTVHASMAIPSIFVPVRINGKLYCDGLVSRNFPVSDVKEMGADYVIGINISEQEDEIENLSVLGILNHIVSYRGFDSTKKERLLADLLIETEELKKYSPTDYSKAKELIALGEKIAREHIDEIRKLSNPEKFEKLQKRKKEFLRQVENNYKELNYVSKVEIRGLKKIQPELIYTILFKNVPFYITKEEMFEKIKKIYATQQFYKVYFEFEGEKLIIEVEERAANYLRIGFNINSYTGTKLFLSTDINNFNLKGYKTVIETEISDTPMASLSHSFFYGIRNKYGMRAKLKYKSDKFNYENEQYKVELSNIDNFIGTISTPYFDGGIGFGVDFFNTDYNNENIEFKSSYFYYIFRYDDLDKDNYPEKGQQLLLDNRLNIDIFNDGNEVRPNKFELNYKNYISIIKESLTLINEYSYYDLKTETDNIGDIKYYCRVGSIDDRENLEFYGLKKDAIVTKNIAVYRLGLQKKLNSLTYLIGKINFGNYKDENLENQFIRGYGITLGYRSIVGPLNLSVTNNALDSGSLVQFNFRFEI